MTLAEKITDTALFEKTVIDILREQYPKYWNMIHGGMQKEKLFSHLLMLFTNFLMEILSYLK